MNLKEVEKVLEDKKESRERNVLEVRNYYNALMYLNQKAEYSNVIDEKLIFEIFNLVSGKNLTHKINYRDGQNIVQDSVSGVIVYMPPEAKDVKDLMAQLIEFINSEELNEIPIPIIAGIFAYEFVTIHPFWDGNGRTSRLLANYILKSNGYDLKGFFVMEEFYDKDIEKYYDSLQMGLHHNYYFGRNQADITKWLEYFISIMASTFEIVGDKVKKIYMDTNYKSNILDTLDKRERWIASYIANNGKIKAKTIASYFKINLDTANNWIKKWQENGFLVKYNETQIRNIDYTLSDKYMNKIKISNK